VSSETRYCREGQVGQQDSKTATDGNTMKKMKAATGLTYFDGTFFDSGVFMASKVSNLIVLEVNSVRIWNVAHSLKESAAFIILLQ
jgi:hypothetical protein